MSIEDTVRQIAICRDEISRLSKVLCDRGASSKVKDLVHEEYHNLEQELRRLTTQWTNELTEREEKKVTYPKPEWIRYKVTYLFKMNGQSDMYIYAHGKQMVREILDDYVVTKIERMDKDG